MSGPIATLRTAVAALADIQQSFTVDDHADGWRQRLVQRRRVLHECIAAIATVWHDIDAEVTDSETGRRFRQSLLHFRSRVAEHQAAWPAVAIDRADPGFLESRRGMRAAHADFRVAAAALFAQFHPSDNKETRP